MTNERSFLRTLEGMTLMLEFTLAKIHLPQMQYLSSSSKGVC